MAVSTCGLMLGDMYTGIHAVAAINAALLGRVKSGRGQHIDMALYDTLVSMHEYAVQCYTMQGIVPEQTGHDMPTSTLYGVFRAADGDIVIAAQVDDRWERFAALVEMHGGPAGFGAGGAVRGALPPLIADRQQAGNGQEPPFAWVVPRTFKRRLHPVTGHPLDKDKRSFINRSGRSVSAVRMSFNKHEAKHGAATAVVTASHCSSLLRCVVPEWYQT
ncbi:UNVERIFIED_ORG: hypothetical protein ABIC54_005719 [Burkholderia sp. 1263]